MFLDPERCLAARAALLTWEYQRRRAHAELVIEKTPDHVFHLDRLLRLVPRARVVCIVRDGRDVVASLNERTGDLVGAIDKWCRAMVETERWLRDPRVHIVHYERLLDEPDGYFRELQRFLGLPVSDLTGIDGTWALALDPAAVPKAPPSIVSGEHHLAYRNWQINQPIFDSRGRSFRMLAQTDQDLIVQRLSPFLRRWNYQSPP